MTGSNRATTIATPKRTVFSGLSFRGSSASILSAVTCTRDLPGCVTRAIVSDGLYMESGYFFVMPKNVNLQPLKEIFRANVLAIHQEDLVGRSAFLSPLPCGDEDYQLIVQPDVIKKILVHLELWEEFTQRRPPSVP